MDNKELSERLSNIRAIRRLTQKDLARLAGISNSYYNEIEKGGKVPSDHVFRLLAKALNVTEEYLRGESEPVQQRELAQLEKAEVSVNVAMIPLVGEVRAGVSMYAQNNIESYIRVDGTTIDPNKAYFYLNVIGDSMNKVIREGDKVLVEHTPCCETGDIVIALFPSGEATIKKVRFKGDSIVLIPESYNSQYIIHTYNQDEVTIVGKVIKAERFF